MKKLSYILSIAGHVLVLLIILSARFPITIRTEPARVVVVRITEPPLPFIANIAPAIASHGVGSPSAADGITTQDAAAGMAGRANAGKAGTGPSSSRGALPFSATGDFSLRNPARGSFRLAPAGRSPDSWAIAIGPEPPPRPLRYRANATRPRAAPDRGSDSGGVFLLPFDIRERVVADWTAAALARIERNWIIPASGRLAFSGQVQITLTVEKQGRQRSLTIDDSTLPELLTLAALHAVQASLPLPPLPENVAGETFSFTFIFAYNG